MASETATATATSITSATTPESQTLTGCIKWFNNGLNYGFITVLSDGEYRNIDVFVHQSNIRTARDCFRTLYTGECVQFELAKSDNDKHPFHAVNVRGFNDVQLRCEVPRGTGFGNGRGRGRGRGNGRGNGRNGFRQGGNVRHNGGNHQQSENSVGATKESETTNVAETTPQTNDVSVVESASVVSAPAPASGTKSRGRGNGRGRGRKVSA